MVKESGWKTIEGTGDRYEISDTGAVRRLGRPLWVDDNGVTHRHQPPKPIKAFAGLSGRLQVDLWCNGRRQRRTLADLVGRAFLGPLPPNRVYVTRVGSSPADVRPANLLAVARRPDRGATA